LAHHSFSPDSFFFVIRRMFREQLDAGKLSGPELAAHSPVIISTFKIAPQAKQRPEVLEILKSIQGPVSAQPDCLACDIYTEVGPGGFILFSEQWESEVALHEHIRSEIYLRILSAAELSGRAPEIRFHRVSDTQGLELIRQLRDGGH
jgi:quinol monooxygenase YgiN